LHLHLLVTMTIRAPKGMKRLFNSETGGHRRERQARKSQPWRHSFPRVLDCCSRGASGDREARPGLK
jgi:hypothetical protein